jgi:transcriptional regulator with XRE-family HTH domain
MLRDERQKQNISATALAAKLRISRTTVTHLESDEARPTLWVLLKIADGLGVDLSKFLAEAMAAKPGRAKRG